MMSFSGGLVVARAAAPLTYALPLLLLGGGGLVFPLSWPGPRLAEWANGVWPTANASLCFLVAALTLLVGNAPRRERMVAMRLGGLLLLGDVLFVMLGSGTGTEWPALTGLAGGAWGDGDNAAGVLAFGGAGLYFLFARRLRPFSLAGLLLACAALLYGALAWLHHFRHLPTGAGEAAFPPPLLLGLLLLVAGLAAHGLTLGGWHGYLARRPDRRLACQGGAIIFVVACAIAILGHADANGSARALHEMSRREQARGLAVELHDMVRESARELERQAEAGARQLRAGWRGEDAARSALERIDKALEGRLAGMYLLEGERVVAAHGAFLAEPWVFEAAWNEGAATRLFWQDGLRLLAERPLPGGRRLRLSADIDARYWRLLEGAGALGERASLCVRDRRSAAALCLPDLAMARAGMSAPLAREESLPSARADGAGFIHVAVAEGLSLVAAPDDRAALAAFRGRAWMTVSAILGLTLLGGWLFQRLAHGRIRDLMQRQALMRATRDHVPAAAITVDDRGRVIDLSPRAEEMFAVSRGNALGMPAARLLSGRGLQDTRGGFRPTWGRPLQVRGRRQRGEGFDAEVGVARYFLAGRRYAVLVVVDITQRLRHEREQEFWELIFNHAEWGIAISDPGGGATLERMNPHFASMHGYRVEELRGRPIELVFAPAEREALGAHIALAHSRGHHGFESIHLRRDGGEFPVLVDVTTVRDATGGVRFRVVNVQDISERKAMEVSLRDAESAQRAMLDSQRDPLFRWRPDGTLEYANTAFAVVFGHQPGELLGMNWLDLLPPEARAVAAARVADLLEQPRRIEYEAQIHGGGPAWFAWSHEPVRDGDGRLVAFQGRAHDITAGKEAERKLAENHGLLRTLFDLRPHPTCLLAVDGTMVRANRALQVLAGMGREELARLEFWRGPWCRGLPTAERLRAAVTSAARGTPDRLETTLRDETGELTTFEIACSPVFAQAGGAVAMVLAEGRDISAARRNEQVAMEREARLRAMAASLSGMVFEFRVEREELRPTYVSDGVDALCGLRAEDLVSGARRLVDRVHADDRPGFADSLRRSAQLTADWKWTGRLRGPRDGDATWVNIRAKPRFAGRQVIWDGVALNITELKEKELEIAASRQALRELSAHREAVREDERKYIAREIHDELGQNLTALRMGLAVLETRGAMRPSDCEGRDEIARLKELADKSIGVVRSVATSLRPAALDMGLDAALTWLAGEFEGRHGIACTLDLAGAPAELPDEMATGLFRIVQESLTNVSRHAAAQKVHVMLRQLGHHLVLEIRDDGKGCDADGGGHKGYGLMGMRERTLMLGGRINIVGLRGQGTTVSVSVPLKPQTRE
jgi:PAS domain S-box-containing protein